VEGSCERVNEPSGSIKCCTIGDFSRRSQLHESRVNMSISVTASYSYKLCTLNYGTGQPNVSGRYEKLCRLLNV
jgi:hypothetical protein